MKFFICLVFSITIFSTNAKAYLPPDQWPVTCWVVHEPIENEYSDDWMGLSYSVECNQEAGLAVPNDKVTNARNAFEASKYCTKNGKNRCKFTGSKNIGKKPAPLNSSKIFAPKM